MAGYEVRAELDPPEALFAEAWLDDGELGLIRQFNSSFVRHPESGSRITGEEILLHVPVAETSSDCLQVVLYDWTFIQQRSDEFCLPENGSETRHMSLHLRTSNLPAGGSIEIPAPPAGSNGCSLSLRQPPSQPFVAMAGTTLLFLLRRRSQRRTRLWTGGCQGIALFANLPRGDA